MIEMDERGYGIPPSKFICGQCISDNSYGDYALVELVQSNMTSMHCDYCGNTSPFPIAADIELVIERVALVMMNRYGTAEEDLPRDNESESGWFGDTLTTEDILEKYFENGTKLFNDLVNTIADNTWCDKDPFSLPEDHMYKYSWERFKQLVQHEKRYMFFKSNDSDLDLNEEFYLEPMEILSVIGNFIREMGMYKEITNEDLLYHVRFNDHYTAFKDLASPPVEFATQPNRMSPPGISMFYAAYEKKVALMETASPDLDGKKFTIGRFSTKKSEYLVDISRASKGISVFDLDKAKYYNVAQFVDKYVKEISKPARKEAGYSSIDYVSTQVLTEFIRYGMDHDHEIIGMQFRSSKSTPQEDFTSIVLFLDHAGSMEHLNFLGYEHHICRYMLDTNGL
ncbi:HEPN-associated N-terminal domain-containing protein [Deinococcus sp. Leaf326]|uniref:HEPN-associated N-terminal domain-containing protein n=1 Tax=Deinococcus sp. Leaf326 TaxID=1736338 RepID=UPI00138EFDB6|nr:HEPN-associated N-terminal domain-containing protein [Deinococcus sp. Leaf326]